MKQDNSHISHEREGAGCLHTYKHFELGLFPENVNNQCQWGEMQNSDKFSSKLHCCLDLRVFFTERSKSWGTNSCRHIVMNILIFLRSVILSKSKNWDYKPFSHGLVNVYCLHICVPVWSIKIMAELLDMKFSLDQSLTCMLFARLKIAWQTAFGELTKPQMLKNINPPTHQQMSIPICELRYKKSNIFGTHNIGQWINMGIYHLVVWVNKEIEIISREEYC